MRFAEFVQANGLQPDRIVADGEWHRCPTRSHPKKLNGAFRLAPDGRIGWAQDWAVALEPSVWRPDQDAEFPEHDPEAIHRAWEEKQQKQREATQAARAFYAECAPLRGGHPYLEVHELGMTGCYGLKVDRDGWLVIPAAKGGRIMTVQRIAPDGSKLFWKGAPVRGASYLVDRRRASITVITEGLATALAIFAAAPLTRVVVGFNAGNLRHIADRPKGLAVIAADNDHGTEARIGSNPGVEAAREAAEALKCGFCVPGGIQGTDYCDLRIERVKERLEDWSRKPWEQEDAIRRAVDAEIAAEISRNARFVVG